MDGACTRWQRSSIWLQNAPGRGASVRPNCQRQRTFYSYCEGEGDLVHAEAAAARRRWRHPRHRCYSGRCCCNAMFVASVLVRGLPAASRSARNLGYEVTLAGPRERSRLSFAIVPRLVHTHTHTHTLTHMHARALCCWHSHVCRVSRNSAKPGPRRDEVHRSGAAQRRAAQSQVVRVVRGGCSAGDDDALVSLVWVQVRARTRAWSRAPAVSCSGYGAPQCSPALPRAPHGT